MLEQEAQNQTLLEVLEVHIMYNYSKYIKLIDSQGFHLAQEALQNLQYE